jgi:hypothetical protein
MLLKIYLIINFKKLIKIYISWSRYKRLYIYKKLTEHHY